MRPQAKPFTVEVKKSRKSSAESKPLFGADLLEGAAAPTAPAASAAADKLFGRPADRASRTPDIASVFGGVAVAERPATRVLPDLTVRAPAQPAEEPERTRRPRIAKTKGPRIPAPKPLPVAMVEPEPVVEIAQPARPAVSIRVRRRPKDETGLTRAERWKRRLPYSAR